jgi:hypothetical protein
MTTSAQPTATPYKQTVSFRYSHAALAAAILSVILTTIPVGRADVALAGFVVMWASLYLFMRRSVGTIRYWATLMAAMFLWFGLVSASGSLGRWAPQADSRSASGPSLESKHVAGVDLHGRARLTGPEVLVTDGADRPWTDVELSFTASDGRRYTSRLDSVAPGQTAVVQLSRFVDADGRPTRTATSRPRAVTVKARIDGAEGAFETRLAAE